MKQVDFSFLHLFGTSHKKSPADARLLYSIEILTIVL